MTHAPVIVVGYTKAATLKRVLENLARCDGIEDRDVFAYVDGPRSERDVVNRNKVLSVFNDAKQYLRGLKIRERQTNYGCKENIVQAINETFDAYDRIILVEDDVLVSRTFLAYMDSSLEFYEKDTRIWGINAYSSRYVHVPASYSFDIYLNPRNATPGWGTWKNRWMAVDFTMKDWNLFKKHEENRIKVDCAGVDLFRMMDIQANDPMQLNAWDIQCTYHMIKNGLFSITPTKSLTKNIGFGMESEHCETDNPAYTTQKYFNFLPKLVKDILPYQSIAKQIPFAFIDPRLDRRILRKLHRMMISLGPRYDQPFDG